MPVARRSGSPIRKSRPLSDPEHLGLAGAPWAPEHVRQYRAAWDPRSLQPLGADFPLQYRDERLDVVPTLFQ